MKTGWVPVAAVVLLTISCLQTKTNAADDFYLEGQEEISPNSQVAQNKRVIRQSWMDIFNPYQTTRVPDDFDDETTEPIDNGSDDEFGSGSLPEQEPELKEKTLRVSFVVNEPYQDQYSNRDSNQFQNLSRSLAQAVNILYESLPGSQHASLVRIQSRVSDEFSCKVTLDIVTTGYEDIKTITRILKDHITNRRKLGTFTVSDNDFNAIIINPGVDLAENCNNDDRLCDNGQCVRNDARCNNIKDCDDGSDENNCPVMPKCTDHELTCKSGMCVPEYERCDGISACDDGSDELDCPLPDDFWPGQDQSNNNSYEQIITTTQISYTDEDTNACINKFPCGGSFMEICDEKVCDGRIDCPRGDDELNCNKIPKDCPADYFSCDKTRCVPIAAKCNNVNDCDDGTDEVGCKTENCERDDFRCHNGKCIEIQRRCDKIWDCTTGEDERGCVCSSDYFTCEIDSSCVELRKRCDGTANCPDGSDEQNCTDNQRAHVCKQGGQFRCRDGTCISVLLRCDGFIDCPRDGLDESGCPCGSDQWQCDHGSCIKRTKRCDGRVDCPADRSDERACFAISTFKCRSGKIIAHHERCNRQYDCPPGDYSDEKNCPCGEGDFECDNGYCIPSSNRCDKVNQCSDGSDERNCKNDTYCLVTQYKCSNGECIIADLRCNGNNDCFDGSDEKNCPCESDQFRCRNGSCINSMLRCDRQIDCHPDGEDEYNCGCPRGYWKCGNSQCISNDKLCNGFKDCSDNSDEQYCNRLLRPSHYPPRCSPEQYTCSSGRCIESNKQCDGHYDCEGHDDEANCPECPDGYSKLCGDRDCVESIKRCDGNYDCPNGEDERDCEECEHSCDNKCLDPNKICDGTFDCSDESDEKGCENCDGPNDFRCSDGECINSQHRCNGLNDCSDSSDELGCENTIIAGPYDRCLPGQFRCNNWDCIDEQFVCDNHRDCLDNSDEMNCRCSEGKFQCRSNGQCIDDINICDGKQDCQDNSDESDCPEPETTVGSVSYRPVYTYDTTHQPPYYNDSNTGYRQTTIPPFITSRPPTLDGCDVNQWRCENGPCIDQNLRCNGHVDCLYDSSDELDCPPNSPVALMLKTYPDQQSIRNGGDVVFQCRDEGPQRAPVRWVREGGRPLRAGSTDKNGRLEMFKVSPADSGVYICQAPRYLGMEGAEIRTYLNVEKSVTTSRPSTLSCRENESTCGNGQCIPKSAVCNGHFDCSDRSDEESCNNGGMCDPNQFECANRRCILKTWLCDNDDDCGDRSDEINCEPVKPGERCLSVEFKCNDSEQCVPRSFHCDGMNDCIDGSDEHGCAAVHITVPPKPSHVRLNTGDVLTLNCEAVGVPVPLISWRLNWGHVPQKCRSTSENGIGRLICPDMQRADSGAYSCEAINNKGTSFATPDAIVQVGDPTSVCPPGYFNSEARSESDCIRCFCFGKSSQCRSADLFTFNMRTPLGEGGTRLLGIKQTYRGQVHVDSQPITDQYYYQPLRNGATVTKLDTFGFSDTLPYIALPESYNGNQLTSYGGHLKYRLQPHAQRQASAVEGVMPDIIIKGQFGTLVHHQRRSRIPQADNEVEVRLTPEYWQKSSDRGLMQVTREDIMMILDNIEYILLRASINGAGVNITDFSMESAQNFDAGLGAASLVEECECSSGYEGLSCHKCASGYVRSSSGTWLGDCVPERPTCPTGTYGDPSNGYACRQCPCPLTNTENQFARSCAIGSEGRVICDCPTGYEGETCEYCASGYVGNPTIPGDRCRPEEISQCNQIGTRSIRLQDQCECKDNVEGIYCDRCKEESFYLNNDFRHGCAECFCTAVIKQCTSSNLRRKTTNVLFNVPEIVSQVKVYNSTPFGPADRTRYNVPVETSLTPRLQNGEMSLTTFDKSQPTIYYWSLPANFAGDKVTSYGGYLRYSINHVYRGSSARNNAPDVQLISENRLTFHYFGNFEATSDGRLEASVQFLENGWRRPDGKEVQREYLLLALSDVKTILIKATYTTNSLFGSLESASIETAEPGGTGPVALHVEQCDCPLGYIGTSCEDCAPGYTRTDTGLYLKTCGQCECNGHSHMCDPETGICSDCADNTAGDNCERCREGYERNINHECIPIYHPPDQCRCDPRGIDSPCIDGYCNCKENVEGDLCNVCRPGSFGLDQENPLGCISCYCSGVARNCYEASNYKRLAMPAPIFGERYGGYTLMSLNADNVINDQFVSATNESELIYIFVAPPNEEMYWSLPQFPGNRVLSYGGKLSLTQRFETGGYAEYSTPGTDVIFVGSDMSIYWSNPNTLRSGESLSYAVPLTEHEWQMLNTGAPLTRNNFMSVLKNLKRILVRATLSEGIGSTAIADVAMDTAIADYDGGVPAKGVEVCVCPEGYTGTSCESCIANSYQDASGKCRLCNCNGHTCQLGPYNEVICNCRPPFTGPDCSSVGLVMELHPTVHARGRFSRTVETTCKYTAPEPLNLQFYLNGEEIDLPPKSSIGSIYDVYGWHGQHKYIFVWDIKNDDDIIECHAITDAGSTLGLLSAKLFKGIDTTSTTTARSPPLYSTVSVKITSPTIMIQEIGSTVNFTCRAHSRMSRQPLSVEWRKSDGELPLHRSYVDNGLLLISNLQVSDSGVYVCQATDGVSTDQDTATLKVPGNKMTVPEVSIKSSYNDYLEGDRITMECVASGNPAPTISWQRSANRALPSSAESYSSYFIIERARLDDSGEYRCIASNPTGTVEALTHITVRPRQTSPTRERLSISPQSATVLEGQSTKVTCTGTLNVPPDSIGWIRQDGTEFPSNVRYNNGVLYIEVAHLDNQGVYLCQSNSPEVHPASIIVTVTPLGPPPVSEQPKVTVSEERLLIPTGGTGIVDCNAHGYPLPIVRWSKHNSQFGPSTTQRDNRLIINNASENDKGYYVCEGLLDSVLVANVYVYVDIERREVPDVMIWPQGEQAVPLDGEFQFHCRVSGVPEPVVSWSRQGDRMLTRTTQMLPNNILKFEKISVNDEGEYICTAENAAGQKSASATIKVRSPPVVVITPSNYISVLQGDPINVECRANGYPLPEVSIKRAEGDLRVVAAPNTGIASFRVSSATERDSGQYVCTATSAAGTITDDIYVAVERGDGGLGGGDEGSGEGEIGGENQHLARTTIAVEGQDATFSCEGGSSDVSVRWSRRNGRPLQPNAVQQYSDLIIYNTSKQDEGEYECSFILIDTGEPQITDYRTLQVMRPPRITLNPLTQTVQPGQSPTVECVVDGDEILEILWRPLRRPVSRRLEIRRSTMIFHQIEVEDAGKYVCFARNRVANASATAEVIVAEPLDRLPSVSHDNEQYGHVGDDVHLSCHVTLAKHRIRWTKDDRALPRSVIHEKDGSLTIKQAQKSHSGRYVCHIRDQYGRSTNNYINLHIEGPICEFRCHDDTRCVEEHFICDGFNDCVDGSDEYDCTLKDMHLSEIMNTDPDYFGARAETSSLVSIDKPRRQYRVGDNVEVTCRSSSRDTQITWDRPGTNQYVDSKAFGGGSTLDLPNVKEADSGVYRCVGTDIYGRTGFDDFNLEVLPVSGGISNAINERDTVHTTYLRDNIVLPCHHDLERPVTIEWRKEYAPIPPHIKTNEPNLVLDSVAESDAGTYICRISNSRSAIEARAVLRVAGIVPRFGGDSWLSLPTLKDSYTQFNIEISFKPMDNNGLILYNNENENGVGDYIALALRDGIPTLLLELDRDNGPITVQGDRPLQLNKWHTIRLRRNKLRVTMDVDNTLQFTADSPGEWVPLDLKQPLYIGGVPAYLRLPPQLLHLPGFIGCISNLVLNRDEANLMTDSLNQYHINPCDTCSPNLCQNNGVCQEARNENGFMCLCPDGFAGLDCSRTGEACRPGICGPGKCKDVGDGYQCACPITYSGKRCEYHQYIEYPAFTGSAYLAINTPKAARLFLMSIKIKATSPITDGIIMYCASSARGQDGFISLTIHNGRLEFKFDLGDGSAPVVLVSSKPVVANEWVEISMKRIAEEVTMKINVTDVVQDRLQSSKRDIQLETPMFIGGYDDSVIINRNVGVTGGFNGCIKDVSLSNKPVDIINTSILSANVKECNKLERGDVPENEVECSKCQNGYCIPGDPNECVCHTGFTGLYCESRSPLFYTPPDRSSDPCGFTSPCHHGGTCREDYSNRYNHTCDCPLGYAGINCQLELELRLSVAFHGNGYLELPSNLVSYEHVNREPAIFAMAIFTERDGVLLYQRQLGTNVDAGDYILLHIEGGVVKFEWDLGSGPSSVTINEVIVVDSERHQIIAKIHYDKRGSLSVDGVDKSVYSDGFSNNMNADSNVYVGGMPEDLNINRYPGFTGCIEQVEFMSVGRGVLLGETAVAGRNTQRCRDNGRV